jgi:methionyl-tRNA synthetase
VLPKRGGRQCRACRDEGLRRHSADHREKIKARQRAAYHANVDARRAKARAAYAVNPEPQRERSRRNHREKRNGL